jgi:transposase-like protein
VTKPPKPPKGPRRPEDRPAQEKLRIVLAAHGLADEELGAFLRREGVHEADLGAWRQALHEAALASLGGPGSETAKERADTKRIKQLESEIRRKDKALAETAALLILKKKVLEIWGDGDDDTKPASDE